MESPILGSQMSSTKFFQ